MTVLGDETGVEGAWSGNDTVWRMTVDLNRILIYGRSDGSMADVPQRLIVHISDGIIAGQGNGPLAPVPFDLGVMLAGSNPAGMDLAAAYLLGFDPGKIPLIQGSFGDYRWPVTRFGSNDVCVKSKERVQPAEELSNEEWLPRPVHFPVGWTSAILPRPELVGLR